jgi:hypothetical protein
LLHTVGQRLVGRVGRIFVAAQEGVDRQAVEPATQRVLQGQGGQQGFAVGGQAALVAGELVEQRGQGREIFFPGIIRRVNRAQIPGVLLGDLGAGGQCLSRKDERSARTCRRPHDGRHEP